MKIIDSNNDLSASQMSEFLSELSFEDIILISFANNEIISSKSKLVNDFTSNEQLKEYSKDSNDKQILFTSENVQLIITSYDYNWWNENTRRIKKLFKSITDEFANLSKAEYTIAIGNYKDSKIQNVSVYCGTKENVIKFLNTELVKRTIDNFLDVNIVICLNYQDSSNDKWYTIGDLIERGIATV